MATNRQREAYVTVGYKTDKASADAVIRQNQQVREAVTAELGKTRQAVVSVEDVAQKLTRELGAVDRGNALKRIADDAIEAGKITKDWAAGLDLVEERLSAIGASDSEIKKVVRSIANAEDTAGGGRVGKVGSIGREIRALPAINLTGGLSTDAVGKILYSADAGLTALGASAGQVTAASLIAAPAIVALAVGMSNYNRQLEQQRVNLAGALTAQNRYYEAISTFTSEQAAQELQTETTRLANLRRQRAETQTALDSAFAQAQAAFTDPLARALDAGGQLPTAQLREQLKELDAQIASTEGYTVRLGDGIRNLEFASRDAANEVERAIQQTERFQQIQTQAQLDEVQMQVRASGMTKQARDERITEIQSEISILEQFKSSSELTWQAASELNAQITSLETEAEVLRRTFNSLADTLEQQASAAQLLDDTTSQQLEASKQYVEARETVFKEEQAWVKFVEDSQNKTRELETESAEKRQEIVEASTEKEVEILQDGAEKRAKVLKDFEIAYTAAVGERDALSGRRTQEKAAKEIDEQDKAQAKQLNKLNDAENKKLQAYQRQYDRQYAQLANAIAAETITRQNALQRASLDAQNASYLLTATQQQYASAAVQAYNVGYLTASNYLAGLQAGGRSGFNSPTPLPAPLPNGGTQGNITLNYNVTGTQNTMTTTQFRNLLQAAATRSGGGSAYQ